MFAGRAGTAGKATGASGTLGAGRRSRTLASPEKKVYLEGTDARVGPA